MAIKVQEPSEKMANKKLMNVQVPVEWIDSRLQCEKRPKKIFERRKRRSLPIINKIDDPATASQNVKQNFVITKCAKTATGIASIAVTPKKLAIIAKNEHVEADSLFSRTQVRNAKTAEMTIEAQPI